MAGNGPTGFCLNQKHIKARNQNTNIAGAVKTGLIIQQLNIKLYVIQLASLICRLLARSK